MKVTYAEGSAASFQDHLRQRLKEAPWFAVSMVIHLIIGLIVANIDWQTMKTDKIEKFITGWETKEITDLEPDDPVEREPVRDQPPEPVDSPVVIDDFTEDPLDEELVDLGPIGVENAAPIGIVGTGTRQVSGKLINRIRRREANVTEKAVAMGLDWLKRHQAPEGYWDSDGFDGFCSIDRCRGTGGALNDVGCTGLALLAFLGAGNTPTSGAFRDEVRTGLRYLCEVQDPENGCLAARENPHYMYNHAVACLALAEAYGLSFWPPVKKHASSALQFVLDSRNPGKAWRYNNGAVIPVEQNDVSVTGWMVLCLASAKEFGLPFDERALSDAILYIDEMTDPGTGRTGYKERGSYSSRERGDEAIWPVERSESMTAAGMFCRYLGAGVFDDIEEHEPMLLKGAALLREKTPVWDVEAGAVDFYYWYYGSYAMFQRGGRDWKAWKEPMVKAVVENQRTEGCAKGSWDPHVDPWGDSGGRVYSTALGVLCLEVFYRYDSIIGSR